MVGGLPLLRAIEPIAANARIHCPLQLTRTIRGLEAKVGYKDLRPKRRQRSRNRSPDAVIAAGNQRDFTLNPGFDQLVPFILSLGGP